MFIIQVNIDNSLEDLVAVETDREVATAKFLDECDMRISNWDEYSSTDIDNILSDGYVQYAGGLKCIVLIDTSNVKTDDELACEIRKEPPAGMKIKRWVEEGEIMSCQVHDVDELLERCVQNLDTACSWEIQGEVLFQGGGRHPMDVQVPAFSECSHGRGASSHQGSDIGIFIH